MKTDTCLVDDCLNPQSPLCTYCECHHLKLCGQLHHRLRQLPPSALLDCKLGEPLMHGPQPYEWCVTHQRLMMTCASAPPSALLSEEQLTDFEHDCETDIGVELADVVKLLAHIRKLQKRLNQTIADDCETDTRCRELLKQWDKSDSYLHEPLEVVIERALKDLRR